MISHIYNNLILIKIFIYIILMKWLWTLLGYKTVNDIKRQRVLDFHFNRAEDYFNKKDGLEAKNLNKSKPTELSQKQIEQRRGWSADYNKAVKSS
tara:strand:+ start:644 stop:928 length:285 start_codon:yes stop_codon:yes gene_type:complete